jgi:hypothetical protein
MTTDFIGLAHLVRSQMGEYERVALFLFECLERERQLNLKALSASSPFVAMTWMSACNRFSFSSHLANDVPATREIHTVSPAHTE